MRGPFGQVATTPYDIEFSLGPIPVRVTAWFWVGTAILGQSSLRLGLEYLLAWAIIVFVSILVHELGHALVARALGHQPWIVLYEMGGYAAYEPRGREPAWKSIAISLAGPAAGLLLYLLLWRLESVVRQELVRDWGTRTQLLWAWIYYQLVYVNFTWSLVNLLPVLPLDGGRISEQLCQSASPRGGRRVALWIGVVVGGAATAWFVWDKNFFAVLMFGFLTYQNVQQLQEQRF